MNQHKLIVGLILLTNLGLAGPRGLHAENWAQWRGPFFNGSTTETGLPTNWSKTDNIAWATPLPGRSGATPVVWGDSIFVSSPDTNRNLFLLCLARQDGHIRWQKQLATGDLEVGHNNLASPSPVTDGKTVYALYGTGDLAALDFTGQVLWARHLDKDFGKFSIMWLYGSSPLLAFGKLYVQVIQRNPSSYKHSKDDKPERESYLLCLDPKTGKDLWRQVRTTNAADESQESYATPIPFHHGNRDEILVAGGDCVTGHDPVTGKEFWRCFGLNPKGDHWRRLVPSPVTAEGFIYACGPKREPVLAIRAGGNGLITDTHIAWKHQESTPDVCTPLYYRGKLFVLDGDKHLLSCLDPKTGDKLWQGRVPAESVMRASLTGADGKLYCLDEAGNVFVLEAGTEFKLLNQIAMGEAPCRSSIAVSGGQLFIRTAKNLYCVGKK
jgi:outer membrane protein assembly factor BamB